MREDQTFVVQSGKPIGVFPGQATTPLVIMANGNIVGEWSREENRRRLDDMGLTIMPGMTAGAWPDRVFSMGGAVDEVRDAREPATIA